MALTILADDLTGACDAGTVFAAKAVVPVTVWPDPPVAALVSVVDTESRELDVRAAADRVGDAAKSCVASTWFKKIDSTMRGHVGAEIEALLDAAGSSGAIACPAFPAQGRTVVDRVLRIDGAPAANVVDLIRPEIGRAVAWIPLSEVRAGSSALASRIERLTGMVAVADAETDDDLDALVGAALSLANPPLLAGSAGLARALARRLGLLGAPPSLPCGRRWLLVAGSRHAATRRQIAAARRAGLRVLATPDEDVADGARAATSLAADVARALAAEAFDLVGVTGGETAVALYRALGAERINLVGAPDAGLAFGHLRSPRYPALPLLTKGGGFGPPDLFVALREKVAA